MIEVWKCELRCNRTRELKYACFHYKTKDSEFFDLYGIDVMGFIQRTCSSNHWYMVRTLSEIIG